MYPTVRDVRVAREYHRRWALAAAKLDAKEARAARRAEASEQRLASMSRRQTFWYTLFAWVFLTCMVPGAVVWALWFGSRH